MMAFESSKDNEECNQHERRHSTQKNIEKAEKTALELL